MPSSWYIGRNRGLAVGLLIAAIYVVINYALSKLAVSLEARRRRTSY